MLTLLVPAGVARADWFEASTNHFVIYGDEGETELTRFSRELEQYNAAMAALTGNVNFTPSPSNRLTVFLVRNEVEVRRLMGGDKKANKYVGGFYRPRAGGSLAIVPRVQSSNGKDLDWSMIVLLHEYAHHFMYSGSSFPMPRWYAEGAAEFYASARFNKDGSVSLGRPAAHRAVELFYAGDVTAEDLLDPDVYEKKRERKSDYDAYYGKAWLLYHYLTFEPARKGQLDTYIKGLIAGQKSRASAEAAFGDLKVLEKELDAYLKRSRMTAIGLKGKAIEPGPVALRRLSEGEVAAMPLIIRSRVGVNKEQAEQVVGEARALARRFPKETAVLSELAEAELDVGNYDAAVAAANAALAVDPRHVRALERKALALFEKAQASGDTKGYRVANEAFVTLNHLENDHPVPLIYYYRGFLARQVKPSPLAVKGLDQAAALAPYDLGLRFELALQQLRDGQSAEARANFAVVAYAIHGGSISDAARAVIERIDKEPDWRGDGATIPGKEEDEPGDTG